MSVRATDIVATILLNVIHTAYCTDHILSCNVTSPEPCPDSHQFCNETSQQCECDEGFTRFDNQCMLPDELPAASHTTAALAAIFTLALVTCGLVLVIRKYKLIEYARQKINLRRSQDVMYEDVMIGQDDPPLSP